MTLSLNKRTLAWIAAIVVMFAVFALPMVAFGQTTPRSDSPDAGFNCSWRAPNGWFQECFWKPLWSNIGSVFLTMGGAFLRFAGLIFDALLDSVIINFGQTMNTFKITGVVNSAWSFFRDLANIFIIGIFVFIAISLILGIKEYGQKRLVARVLIIAVLMNFSLLFAKIVIDASNYIAFTIYSQTAATACATAPPPGGRQGIADRFLCPLGITSVWDTSRVTSQVARQANGGAIKAFVFGLFGGILLMIVGIVLLYGAFLIASRAILFIFLMMIAPIAFASYLMPNLESAPFGWKNWWKALFNNAAFAPLLVMFLTISIFIVGQASSAANGITFGQVLGSFDQATLQDGWKVLFLYIISVGLLFTSFKMSSQLAGSISGYKLGHMAQTLPFVGAAMAGSKFAQYTAGRNAAGKADQKGAQMQAARLQALRSGKVDDWARVEQLRKEKAALEKKANSTFNPMNSFLGKQLAKGTGLAGAGITGETKGSFVKDMHDKAVAAEDKLKAMQPTKEDKKAVEGEAIDAAKEAAAKDILDAETKANEAKAALEKAEKDKASIESERAAADQQVDQNRQSKQTEIQTAEVEIKQGTQMKSQMQTSHEVNISAMMQEAKALQGAARDAKVLEIETARAAHQSAIDAQDNRINNARKQIDTFEKEITAPRTALDDRIAQAQKIIDDRAKDHQEAAKRLAEAQHKVDKDGQLVVTEAKKAGREGVKAFEAVADVNFEKGKQQLAQKTAGPFGGHEGEHIVKHHFDEKFKKKTGTDSILDALKGLKADDKKDAH